MSTSSKKSSGLYPLYVFALAVAICILVYAIGVVVSG